MSKSRWARCLFVALLLPGVLPAQKYRKAVREFSGYYQGEGNKAYAFDWYAPENAGDSLRPLVINLHGGGFKLGNKRSASTPFFSRAYAAHGFYCASINYRDGEGRPLNNFEDLKAACYQATEDLGIAIRYFKAHAAAFHIDTNHIILAGNSAGAMTVLQYVYRFPGNVSPNGITAIVNCWGALFDSSWISRARVPIVSVTGSSDRVISPKKGAGPACASNCIHAGAEKAGIPNRLKVYPGIGHELHRHFNPLFAGFGVRKRWKSATVFILSFLDEQF